jgi:protein phosphatase
VRFGQLADVGRRRAHNEDNLAVSSFRVGYGELDARFDVGVVCDGMGGAAGGEVASSIAVEALLRSLYTHLLNAYMDRSTSFLTVHRILEGAVQSANSAVYQEAHSRPGFSGMGCTATVMLGCHGRVFFGQVGDSRGYQIRGGQITQVTMDHSFVSELQREGRLTAEEAESHPRKSVITRAIGSRPEVAPDVFEVPVQAGDVYLVCSDGLSGMVPDPDMLALVDSMAGDPDEAELTRICRELVDTANLAGGTDNISVVLAYVEESDVLKLQDPIPLVPEADSVLTWTDAAQRELTDRSFQDLRLGKRRA